jgi:hypothetical protein
MRFTVVYEPDAQDTLIDLWLTAPDQAAAFAAASNQIDRLLGTAPDRCGRPVGLLRMLEVPPVAVLYHVSPADCMVRVIAVRRVP